MFEKIFRLFLKLVTPLFIWDKEKRKEFVRHVSRFKFSFCSIPQYKALMSKPLKNKSVLIIEPNDFHGEVILGYAEYFTMLGYDVDIIVTPNQMKTNPFNLCQLENVRWFAINEVFFKKILSSPKAQEYTCVLFSSIDGMHGSVVRYVDNKMYHKTLAVLHNKVHLEKEDNKMLYDDSKLLVLRNFSNDKKLFEVNPHYFGTVSPQPRNKTVNFVTVGLLDPKRRNGSLIADAIRYLTDNGFKDFKITVICRRKTGKFPKEAAPYLDVKVGLKYDAMYKELEKADYFLPLLDPTNEGQREYLSLLSTGSIQLILGFLCPAVINEEFAAAYGFNEENAILYRDNDLAEAMLRALRQSNDDYKQMKANLLELSDAKKESSLNNLKKVMVGE